MARWSKRHPTQAQGLGGWITPVAIWVCAFAFFAAYCRFNLNVFDEGVLLEGIRLQQAGKMDFSRFCHYSAIYKFFAVLMGDSPVDIELTRWTWVVVRATTATLVWWIAVRLLPAYWALLPVLLFIAAPGPWHKSHVAFAVCLSTHALLLAHEAQSLKGHIWLACCLALAIALHPYTGGLSVIASLIVVLHISPKAALGRSGILNGRLWLRRFLPAALALIGFTFLFADFFRQVLPWVFLAQTMTVARFGIMSSVSFAQQLFDWSGHPQHAFVFLTYVIVLCTLLGAAWLGCSVSTSTGTGSPDQAPLRVVLLMALFNLVKWFVPFDLPHLLQNALLPWILLTLLLHQLLRRQGRWTKQRLALGLLLSLWAVAFVGNGVRQPEYYVGGIGARFSQSTVPFPHPRGTLQVTEDDAEWLGELNQVIRNNSRPGEPILICAPVPILYYLAERPNVLVLPIFNLAASLFANPEKEVIGRLRRSGVRLVLINDQAFHGVEAHRISHFAPQLYQMLMEEFEPIATVVGVQVRLRKR